MHILIVDDHPLLRCGARQHIAARWPEARVTEADTLAQSEAIVAEQAPDCLILDLSLEDASGLEGLTRMRRLAPPVPILVLSGHSEEAYAAKALRLGAAGYLNKKCACGDLVQAMEQILLGKRYVTPSLAGRLADLFSCGGALLPHETLSDQEMRMLILIGAGQSVGRIAAAMHLSVKTVSTYRARILEKMDLASNADLTRYCLSHGLIHL